MHTTNEHLILSRGNKRLRWSAIAAVFALAGLIWLLASAMIPHSFAATDHPSTRLDANRGIVFNRDIRPILADRCFSCHGPDPNKRQAGLRLDRPEAAMGQLPKHPNLRAFVAGDPDHSEALKRILTADPVAIMPPPTSHLKLTAAEKELIRRWVSEGEPYQEHWAFNKPVRPKLPEVQQTSWPKNGIDRFVLSNLESHGLHPSQQADRPTLIRRVSLDLTGLPPTPAEVDTFVADTSPDAYEKVVDRLLASPAYGEQMATTWLDYARYADSHGYQSDPERHMWKWRDWVINAYNNNMPFDQFTIEQLAGDLLPNATVDQKIASGFNRNHRINDEGGIIGEEWRVEGVIDRVSTTSAVFLGLTMECCRCHDHKYDPITQKEFYSFSAYFNSVNEVGIGSTALTDKGINVAPILKVPTADQQEHLDELAGQVESAKTALTAARKRLPELVAKIQQADTNNSRPNGPTGNQSASRPSEYSIPPAPGLLASIPLNGNLEAEDAQGYPIDTAFTAQPIYVDSPMGKALQFDGSGKVVNLGDILSFDWKKPFSYGAWVNRQGGGAFLSKMDSKNGFRGFDLYMDGDRVAVHLIHQWPDNVIKVHTAATLPKDTWTHAMATYDGSGKAAGVKIYFNGKPQRLEILNDTLTGSILNKSPVLVGARDGSDPFTGEISNAQFYNRVLNLREIGLLSRSVEILRILATPLDDRTMQQEMQLAIFVESTDSAIVDATEALEKVEAETVAYQKQIPDTMVMQDLPKPRDTFVLLRGEYDKHGEKVTPGVPAVLSPLPKDAPPNRLGMARWIVDPQNPITARVQANRLWEKFFGIGLVKTSENLGTQTEWPSNPELLDWLATEMLQQKWNLKAFQKQIVMSAAYQQSSQVTQEMVETDPENRLIERGPRFRLTAEEVRDQALATSGLLVEKIGGPSARPYEPADLWAGNSFGNLAKYVADKGDGLYRRSMYTFIKRSAVPANLSLFDQPSREYCVIRRSRTNTPLQALDLMNDITYLEAARVMAQKVMAGDVGEGADKKMTGPTPADRIIEAFKRVTCRKPTSEELDVLVQGFTRELAHFKSDGEAASKLVSVGETPIDSKLPTPELAAYTMTCSIILNLDEAITRQ